MDSKDRDNIRKKENERKLIEESRKERDREVKEREIARKKEK